MTQNQERDVSSNTKVLLQESQVRKLGGDGEACCFRVEIDVDGSTLPTGLHVLAPDRDCAVNKLAVAIRRLGVESDCLDRLNFVEE